ncbi:MAG: M16 family metallopeptidase [Treponemataceae bacterium]
MSKKKSFFALCFIFFILIQLPLFAQKTLINNLFQYKLPNGLDLFVVENETAPVAYIEIAIKAGAIAQTKETAGLFHLYEHMMFKGNRKFRTAAEVQRAINDLGVASWNGSTGIDFVNYFFTIPSDYLEQGLEFWSYAIRNPLLNRDELENEKKVVLAEITGGMSDPDQIYRAAYLKKLFPDYPWRLDPGGSLDSIKNATTSELRDIQEKYYLPNNAALFVGGNVKHKDVFNLVHKIFGKWERGGDPWKDKREVATRNPFNDTTYLVMPNPKISPDNAKVSIYLRGPDTAVDVTSTYAADVLSTLLENPFGSYKINLLLNEDLGIPDIESISSYYGTYKESGIFVFSTTMLDPKNDLPFRGYQFFEEVTKSFFPSIVEDVNFFSREEYNFVKQRIQDTQIYGQESADDFLKTLRFWWASTSTDYFFSYIENMKKVTSRDISRLLTNYIIDKPALVTILVNSDIYKQISQDFAQSGYEVVTSENAFWFK